MKKYIFSLLVLVSALTACKKSTLQLANPNNPTPLSLSTEAGVESFAQGIFAKWIADVPGEGSTNIMQIALMMHSNMGDEDFSPWANWGMRYSANVTSITLPAPYNKTWVNPTGLSQKDILAANNSRKAGEANSTQYEWNVCNFMNVQANTLLLALENPALKFSGDGVTKKGILKAWGYWWKGYAYSRLGSMYLSAIINNESGTGITNGNFSDHKAVITEGNSNFDKAAAILNTLTENADYDEVFKTIVPSFNLNTKIVGPAMWIRQINTYKARNFLANTKVATMTSADWATVSTLTAAGMIKGDNSFYFGMAAGAINDLSSNFYHPYAFHSAGNGFAWVSERLIQEFKSNDKRLATGFNIISAGPVVNVRNRGIQFGTRYYAIDIENGGNYATDNSMGAVSIAGTWEENSLMIAEGKIRTGSDIDGGLTLVDAVRDAQGAGLAHVANTGLTQAQATEEFRTERRVALYLHGVAFYDARRWGVTTAVANGGGRANANILVPGSLTGNNSATIVPSLIDYNYVDYWDIPQNELDFNGAAVGSAPIKN